VLLHPLSQLSALTRLDMSANDLTQQLTSFYQAPNFGISVQGRDPAPHQRALVS
jgi:hypothetical protein